MFLLIPYLEVHIRPENLIYLYRDYNQISVSFWIGEHRREIQTFINNRDKSPDEVWETILDAFRYANSGYNLIQVQEKTKYIPSSSIDACEVLFVGGSSYKIEFHTSENETYILPYEGDYMLSKHAAANILQTMTTDGYDRNSHLLSLNSIMLRAPE